MIRPAPFVHELGASNIDYTRMQNANTKYLLERISVQNVLSIESTLKEDYV